ncbi:hypothetical protein ILUMI_25526 [Ignelater luminosus]|uniref:Uncharacterized protein n=1 Tax=Ignelater luminosus TaxID=2038154 RepID=A0A8K0FXU6_IGNLU|nr:hypothetical protein ILUMI_25526 [Ignelater luminosus]
MEEMKEKFNSNIELLLAKKEALKKAEDDLHTNFQDNDPQCPEQVIDDRDDNSDTIIQATSSENNNQKEIKVKRKNAHENLKIQGAKMLKFSDIKFSTIHVADTVRIRVPDVDRGRGDLRSILGTILETQDGVS